MPKTLVLFAHPFFEFPDSNQELIAMYQNKEQFDFIDLYEVYPNFHIPAFRERKRLSKYSKIVFHFPLIWFDMPPLLRLWLDEVIDGSWTKEYIDNPLEGKNIYIIITSISKEKSFGENGKYIYSIEDLLAGFLITLKIFKTKIHPIYVVYESESQSFKEIEAHKANFLNLINPTSI
ncbi:MAG TPA: NAD(P)H-dependent oxidoreductase [Edaphocola sp.]|nr:NAD(P)H-dependent oxidoreductase [Edaphocola sp.]